MIALTERVASCVEFGISNRSAIYEILATGLITLRDHTKLPETYPT